MSGSDRYRGLTVALSAAATFVFMVGVIAAIILGQYTKLHEVETRYQERAEKDRSKAAQIIEQSCIGMAPSKRRTDCLVDQIKAHDSQKATDEDLRAQKDMAHWAKLMFFASFATVIVAALGVYYVRLTLKATQETLREARLATAASQTAANIAEKRYRNLERPYILVAELVVQLGREYQPNELVDLYLKNFGNAPGIMESVSAHVLVSVECPFKDCCKGISHPSASGAVYVAGEKAQRTRMRLAGIPTTDAKYWLCAVIMYRSPQGGSFWSELCLRYNFQTGQFEPHLASMNRSDTGVYPGPANSEPDNPPA